MKLNINKNISVWRGNDTPPTDYHIWIKDDGSLNIKILDKWVNKDLLYDYKTSDLTNQDLLINDTDTVYQAIGKLEKAIIDNELVTANSILHIVNKIELIKEEVVAKDEQVFEKGTGNLSILSIDSNCKATGDYSVAAGFHAYASGRGSMALCRGGEAIGSNSVCLGGVIYGIYVTGKGNDTEYILDKLYADSLELLIGCKILRVPDFAHIATIISTKFEDYVLKVYTDNTLSDSDITNKQFGILISKAMGNQSLTYGGGTTIGLYCFSGGFATIATGKLSIALGERTNSVGDNSFCVGFGVSSSGKYSSAIGTDGIYAIYLSSYDSLGNLLNENEYRISKGSNFRTLRGLKSLVGSYININIGLYLNKTVYPKVLSYEIKLDGYYIKLSYSLGIVQDKEHVVFFQDASGFSAVSENCSKSKGYLSHSGGFFTSVEGDTSFGFGYYNDIKGNSSVGIGDFLETSNNNETAFGINNITHKGDDISLQTLFSVGNGEVNEVDHTNYIPVEDNGERNAIEIMKNGDVYIPGNIYNNSYGEDKKPLHSLPDLVSNIANTQLKLSEELDGKAPKVGYAPDLKVDFAKELVGRGVAEPQEIGTIRPTGEISIGDGNATIEKIKGNSVVWNQLCNYNKLSLAFGLTIEKTNGGLRIYGTSTRTGASSFRITMDTRRRDMSKKYLVYDELRSSYKLSLNSTDYCVVIHTNLVEGEYYDIILAPKVHDLTQMFGAGNEPTTLEEFEARKPFGVTDDYNEGEIISYDGANELKSVGFNAWDEEWEYGDISNNGENIPSTNIIRSKNYIPLIPNQTYRVEYPNISNTYMGLKLYDNNKNWIANSTIGGGNGQNFNSGNDYAYARFTFPKESYSTICIHLAHTGYRNGEYVPYEEDTLQLPNIKDIKDNDGNQLFPYGLLSAGSVHDEITATKAVKRIGVVDLGGKVTTMISQREGKFLYSASIPNIAKGVLNVKLQAIVNSGKYTVGTQQDWPNYINIISSYNGTNGRVIVSSEIEGVASINEDLQGVLLYYELAEPIEVDLEEPLNLTYDAWDFGTEELIAEGATTPLNADVVYQFNAVDRIRENTTQISSLGETKADKEYTNELMSQAVEDAKDYTDTQIAATLGTINEQLSSI